MNAATSSPLFRRAAATIAVAGTMLAGAAPLATQLAAPGAAHAATRASTATVQYLKPAFSNSIYKVVAGQSATKLSYSQWVAAGSPKPGVLPMMYVKYPWQSDLYAVSFIAGSDRSRWVWEKLSFEQWRSVGFPRPSTAGWIAGSTYYTMPDAPDAVYVALNGVTHKLSFAEWLAAGQPSPFRVPTTLLKLSWQSTIVATPSPRSPMFNSTPITMAQWGNYRYAPPRVAASFPGDMLYQSCTSSTLFYSGPTFEGPITFAQWQAMGYRTPLSCDAARNTALKDASNYLTSRGMTSSIAVKDNKSGRTYTLNAATTQWYISTSKVFYAAALAKQAQNAGRALSATEKSYIWKSLTVSDNAATEWIYARIGKSAGAQSYARSLGLTGLSFTDNWSWMRGNALTGVDLINKITAGQGLNATNKAYLLSALRSVTPSQRWGVPATTATVSLKNGWVDDKGLYDMHTLHNVQGANRSYSAAIFTVGRQTYDKNVVTAASARIYRAMQ